MTKTHKNLKTPSLVGQRDSELPHANGPEPEPSSARGASMWSEGRPTERPALEADDTSAAAVTEDDPAATSRADDTLESLTPLDEAAAVEIAPDERGEADPRRDD